MEEDVVHHPNVPQSSFPSNTTPTSEPTNKATNSFAGFASHEGKNNGPSLHGIPENDGVNLDKPTKIPDQPWVRIMLLFILMVNASV